MINKKIFLPEMISIETSNKYKLHFGRRNDDGVEPLDEWVRDKSLWANWQEYKPKKDEFNRQYIFSLMNFYHNENIWLFGGIFEVLARTGKKYDVKLTEQAGAFIGRLKLFYPYKNRATRVKFEKHYENMEVSELIEEGYSGRIFPGYGQINLSFGELEAIVRNERPSWKQALEMVKGIYLIKDVKTEKQYVGAAYGDSGIWSRWKKYVLTGHGGNVELRALAPDTNIDYYRANFQFTLLEQHMDNVSDETIIARECFWKNALHSRGVMGLNRN